MTLSMAKLQDLRIIFKKHLEIRKLVHTFVCTFLFKQNSEMKVNSKLKVRPIIGTTMLVAAFPGTGKSFYVNNAYIPKGYASDSDSSKFDKSSFPANYIEHIKQKISEGYSEVFISSHKDVRNALVENDLPFVLIYPAKELKEEYLERYQKRGSGEKFIQLVCDNWDGWIDECKAQTGCFHIELKSGQFVWDVMQ